jgi:hypothetical protein
MGIWQDFKDWANENFSTTDPANNPYADIDRSNFDLPGYGGRDQFSNDQMRGAHGRGAFTAADSAFRNDQRSMLDQYKRMYYNDDESLAIQQAQRDRANASAQQRSLMASASPSNAAMAARVGAQNIGRADQGISGNAIIGRIAERQGLAGNMTNIAGMGRAQDINLNQFNASQGQAARNANDAYALGMFSGNLANAAQQQQGGENYEANRTSRFGIVAGQPTGAERVIGGIAGAGTQIAGAMMGNPGAAAKTGGARSAGYTPGAFGQPMQLQTGINAMPYSPTATQVGYTPGLYGQGMTLDSTWGGTPAWGNKPAYFAEGGIVTKPTNAIIGEAGPEAVIPLPYLAQIMKSLQRAEQAKRGSVTESGPTSVDKFNVGVGNAEVEKPRPKFKVTVGKPVMEKDRQFLNDVDAITLRGQSQGDQKPMVIPNPNFQGDSSSDYARWAPIEAAKPPRQYGPPIPQEGPPAPTEPTPGPVMSSLERLSNLLKGSRRK